MRGPCIAAAPAGRCGDWAGACAGVCAEPTIDTKPSIAIAERAAEAALRSHLDAGALLRSSCCMANAHSVSPAPTTTYCVPSSS